MYRITCPTTAHRAAAIAALLALLYACATASIEPWATSEPLNAPESVYLDPGSGVLFVSHSERVGPFACPGPAAST